MRQGDIDLMRKRAMRRPVVAGGALGKSTEVINATARTLVALDVVKDPFQMDGMPIWLAGFQYLTAMTQDVLPWGMWTPTQRNNAHMDLLAVLDGVGRNERMRLYRSSTTLFLSKSINGAEWEALPQDTFHEADPYRDPYAPVEVLWENWQSRAGAYPCENPSRVGPPLTYVPVDCGTCPPCVDRKTFKSEKQKWREQQHDANREREAYEAFIATPEGQQWLLDRDRQARERGDY